MAPLRTVEELEELIGATDAILERLDKSAASRVKSHKHESDLLKQFEVLRDIMDITLGDSTDRACLVQMFGGDCARIARVRAMVESARFSTKANRADRRVPACLHKCQCVEEVLRDMGHARALRAAQAASKDAIMQRRLDFRVEAANKVLEELGAATAAMEAVDIASLRGLGAATGFSLSSDCPTLAPTLTAGGPGLSEGVLLQANGSPPSAEADGGLLEAGGQKARSQLSALPESPADGDALPEGPGLIKGGAPPRSVPLESLASHSDASLLPPTRGDSPEDIAPSQLPTLLGGGGAIAEGGSPKAPDHVRLHAAYIPEGPHFAAAPAARAGAPRRSLSAALLAPQAAKAPPETDSDSSGPGRSPTAPRIPVKVEVLSDSQSDASETGLTPAASRVPVEVQVEVVAQQPARPEARCPTEPIGCPGSHALGEFKVGSSAGRGVVCDCCGRAVGEGESIWGCRICNWDACSGCSRVGGRPAATAAVRAPVPVAVETVRPAVASPGHQEARMSEALQSGSLRELSQRAFAEADSRRLGYLQWNCGEIRMFITKVFHELQVPPPTERQMYAMYSRFDSNGDWRLEPTECVSLIELLICSLFSLESDGRTGRLAVAVHGGDMSALVEQAFHRCDSDGSGKLDWNRGEIRNFVFGVFSALKLPIPQEQHLYAMFSTFDTDMDRSLDLPECHELAQALCRSLVRVDAADADCCCVTGHVLQIFTTPVPGHACSVCNCRFPKDTVLWQCGPCSFNMCVSCQKSRRKSSAMR